MTTTVKLNIDVDNITSIHNYPYLDFAELTAEYQLQDLQRASLCLMENPTFTSVCIPCQLDFKLGEYHAGDADIMKWTLKTGVLELQRGELNLKFEDSGEHNTWTTPLWDITTPGLFADTLIVPVLDPRQLGDKPSHLVDSPEGWRHGTAPNSALMISSLLTKD